MNVLFINDSSSNPNWGDRAAAVALKRMIIASGGTISGVITEDDLRDCVFFHGRTGSSITEDGRRSLKEWARLLVPPVLLKLRERVLSRFVQQDATDPIPITLDDFERHAAAIFDEREGFGNLIDLIHAADLVLIHGDGCMVGNGVIARSELFLSYLIKTRFEKPVILVNHTADFTHPELSRMADAVYPLLDDVTYRDTISADLYRKRWAGRYAADSAFLFEPADLDSWARIASRPTYFDIWPDEAPFDPTQPYICIGGSSIYSFHGTPTGIIEGFVAMVSHLRRTYPGQVVLTASDLKDEIIFRPVAKTLCLPLVGLTIPVQQAVDIIGNAQAYVGGRWHPSIFALRGGAPVVSLASKTFKVEALMQMAGLPASLFDAHDLPGNREAIAETLKDLLRQGEALRIRLRHWAGGQAADSWNNVAFLRQWQSRRTPDSPPARHSMDTKGEATA